MTYEVLWTFDGKVWKTIVITREKKNHGDVKVSIIGNRDAM